MKKGLSIVLICLSLLSVAACSPSGGYTRPYDAPEYDDDTRTDSDRRADEAEAEAREAKERAEELEREAYDAAVEAEEEEEFESMYGSDEDD